MNNETAIIQRTQDVSSEASQRGVDLLDKIASFQMPSQSEYIDSLTNMHLAVAIILFACGLVYMLHGWKVFKMLVVINAAILGGFLGNRFGGLLQGHNMPLFGGIAGAVLFAVMAWPLMKFAVSLMGGLAGSFLGYGLWSYVAEAVGKDAPAQYAWAGALIGLITIGLLAFLIFKIVVMIFTSVQGSVMTVSGILAIVMSLQSLQSALRPALMTNAHLLALLIGVPAVIGFLMQYTAMASKVRKKRKAFEGDG